MSVGIVEPSRVVIDPTQETDHKSSTFGVKRRRGEFREIKLTKEQKAFVCFRIMESTNNEVSDTYHPPESEWTKEYTGMPPSLSAMGLEPRIFVKDLYQGEVPLSDEMGIIIKYSGECQGARSLNSAGEVVSIAEAEERMELGGGGEPEVFNLWNFHIKGVAITNGPELKERAMDTADEQRKGSEAKMMDSILSAFERVGGCDTENLNIKDMPKSKEDVNKFLLEHLSDMDEVERYALIDKIEEQRDEDEIKSSAPESGDEGGEEPESTLNISLSKGSDHVDNREVKKRGVFPHKTTLPNPKE